MARRKTFHFVAFGAVLVMALALRGTLITADPPTRLSWSGGLFFDEGALAHNARNKVLFGRWRLDEWNDVFYSPLLTGLKWGVLTLFGVGLVQVRMISVAFSLLTIAFLYLAARHSYPPRTALLGAVFLSIN